MKGPGPSSQPPRSAVRRDMPKRRACWPHHAVLVRAVPQFTNSNPPHWYEYRTGGRKCRKRREAPILTRVLTF
eukprot:scaffold301689_cov27-Prasinocladus_malaysianus.AAC.1